MQLYVIFQLTLEFYEKKARWLLPAEITNWEVWHLQLFIFDPASEEGMCDNEVGVAVWTRVVGVAVCVTEC